MRGYVPQAKACFSAEAFCCNWDIPVLGCMRFAKRGAGVIEIELRRKDDDARNSILL